MASEVKCPYNDEVILQGVADKDSTFNILTPFSFSKMEDHSYAISEGWTVVPEIKTIKHYDEAGNYIYTETPVDETGKPYTTGNTILSASGYNYHFPWAVELNDKANMTSANNSIGWFNSWGQAEGSINYSMGNDWGYILQESALNFINNPNVSNQIFAKVSGKLGLSDKDAMYIFAVNNDTQSILYDFYVKNNNSFFDYLLNGQRYGYLKVKRPLAAVDENNEILDGGSREEYWMKLLPECITTVTSDKKCYVKDWPNGAEVEKTKQAIEFGHPNLVYPTVTQTNKVFFTPTQIENYFDIDLNNPESYYHIGTEGNYIGKECRYEWRIYGAYWYNGRKIYMECNWPLQVKFNEFMSVQKIKQNYESWSIFITYVTQLTSDIIYDNIEYANLVLVKSYKNKNDLWAECGPDYRWVIGSTMSFSFTVYAGGSLGNFTNIDINGLNKGDLLTLSTPAVASKPLFLMNDVFLIDFPCYKFFGNTMNEAYTTNFVYDSKNNKTTFNLIVDGLVADDLTVTNDAKDDWRIIGKQNAYIVPRIFDNNRDYKTCYDNHCRPVGLQDARSVYPISTDMPSSATPGLYLKPKATLDGKAFGNDKNELTLGSRYPMTPNAAVRFNIKTIFTIEVDGDVVEHYFTISSPSMEQSTEKLVRYNRLDTADNIKFEKLDPTIDRVVNGCTLHAYMYDATKIKAKYELSGGKELTFKNENVYITLSDNTGEGKSVVDLKLSDIANGEYGDLIFSSGLVKNEAEKCYEFTIFISAKCSNDDFAGLGFNDSTVLVRFDLDEEYKELYNLRDIDYHTFYITALPPYLVQGIPFTKEPELEQVLNSKISPENASARVDYLYNSYQDNSYGYTQDALFTNASPLYVCVASAFIPAHFNGTISGLDCTMYDTWTNCRRSIPWESADAGSTDYTVITSAGTGGYSTTNTDKIGTASLKLWTIEQTLDVESVKNKKGTVSNRLEVSAHLDYTTIDESLETQNMVIISSSN